MKGHIVHPHKVEPKKSAYAMGCAPSCPAQETCTHPTGMVKPLANWTLLGAAEFH
jgi:hypothetical protein